MRGVAKERDAALAPLRQRIAVVDAPFVDLLDVAEHFQERFVPAGLGGNQLLSARRHRPGFLDPLFRDMAAEDVELVAFDADRITDDVAVRPDPAEILAVFDFDAAAGPDAGRHAIHRHDGAPGHHPGVARLACAEMLRAHRRPYA